MSTPKNDGGPAFPCLERGGGGLELTAVGLSIRDYFAAQFIARAQSLVEHGGGWDFDTAAQCAYQMADAMLAERSKT